MEWVLNFVGVSRWVVGGPATALLPDYLADVATVLDSCPGILQRVNPLATRSTLGCPRACPWCGVNRIEPGGFVELDDWPDLPIYCDNNLLAASRKHFDRVIDRAKRHPWVDFNQGLDARLLSSYHANRLAECNVIVRLSWDRVKGDLPVMAAWDRLRAAGIPKRRIRFYVLIGFRDTPADALYRLQAIRDLGALPCPMRYVPLDSLTPHYVDPSTWTHRELMRFMRYWSNGRLWAVPFEEFRGRRE